MIFFYAMQIEIFVGKENKGHIHKRGDRRIESSTMMIVIRIIIIIIIMVAVTVIIQI